jgi:glycosyltransferase involved in cell wall biosynthesis
LARATAFEKLRLVNPVGRAVLEKRSVPKVSIILPTFNRRDTVMRAIRSAQAQTFQDWELIAVDDGSTDDTAVLIAGADPRLTVIRQTNAGMTEARNTGIRAAKGEYIAFLDSDDEFLPHHLELCVAFLETFKEEMIVSTELLEDFGHGRVVNHYRIETSAWYPDKAAIIGTHGFDLPSGETDDYLRVYQSREAIGEWGRAIVEGIDKKWDGAFLYRGMIFDFMRNLGPAGSRVAQWIGFPLFGAHLQDLAGKFHLGAYIRQARIRRGWRDPFPRTHRDGKFGIGFRQGLAESLGRSILERRAARSGGARTAKSQTILDGGVSVETGAA